MSSSFADDAALTAQAAQQGQALSSGDLEGIPHQRSSSVSSSGSASFSASRTSMSNFDLALPKPLRSTYEHLRVPYSYAMFSSISTFIAICLCVSPPPLSLLSPVAVRLLKLSP
jgi:hypothetical protein